MSRRVHQPTVRTIEPHEAHPLYLLAERWKGIGMQLAAALALSGRQDAGRAVMAAADSAAGALRDLPHLPEGCGRHG